MIRVSPREVVEALARVGISRGQTVYVQIDLRTVGVIEGATSREAYCQTYLDALFELIGPEGTVVVPTYTTQVARFDLDFVWEETPTVLGTFPEYVRRHPNGLRSIHPLHSVTALGARRNLICGDNGLSDFGWHSPFQRMLEHGAKIVTIGLESGYVVGISHHLDAACCSPYVYNKLLKWVPLVRGRRVPNRYVSVARHLDIAVTYYLRPFVRHMRARGEVTSAPLGGAWVHMADYGDVFREGAVQMAKDPFCMLKEAPGFVYGRVPFDGPTAGRDGIAVAEESRNATATNWSGYYLDRTSPGGDEDELCAAAAAKP